MSQLVAIVGSRTFPNLSLVEKCVRNLPDDATVVSGGARGVDRRGEAAAERRGLSITSFRPRDRGDGSFVVDVWNFDGQRWTRKMTDGVYPNFAKAAFARNVRIAHLCDVMYAFHHGDTPGTRHVIQKARDVGKAVWVERA